MALQILKTLSSGVVASECYLKINIIEYLPKYRVTIGLYYNKDARDKKLSILENRVIDLIDQESRADIYNYLKTLPEFAEAIDV